MTVSSGDRIAADYCTLQSATAETVKLQDAATETGTRLYVAQSSPNHSALSYRQRLSTLTLDSARASYAMSLCTTSLVGDGSRRSIIVPLVNRR